MIRKQNAKYKVVDASIRASLEQSELMHKIAVGDKIYHKIVAANKRSHRIDKVIISRQIPQKLSDHYSITVFGERADYGYNILDIVLFPKEVTVSSDDEYKNHAMTPEVFSRSWELTKILSKIQG